MKLNLDLGTDGGGPCCAPCKSEDDHKYYPSIYYSGKKKLEIPKEGTMVIRFRKTGSSHNVNSDDEDQYSCTIEVREIVSVDGEASVEMPAKNRSKDSEDALDALRAALSKEKKSESDSESY